MKIIKNIDEIPALKNAVVTTGSFDGVHLGHKAIIKKTTDCAKMIGGVSVVVTFLPHPQLVLRSKEKNIFILNTLEEKARLLNALGIDHMLVIPFTKEFATLPYGDFIRNFIAEKLHARILVIGYDHHFGSNREGSIKHLVRLGKEYSFSVEEVAAQEFNGISVSSTKIRNALLSGDIRTANAFLGYRYSLTGIVVKGDGLGRTFGYPTANIEVDEKEKLIPADGAYAVTVAVDDENYKGMLNTGIRPTVGGTKKVTEVNIFDFSSDIYGKNITVLFAERLRGEIKFRKTEELREQLQKDKIHSLKILSE